MDGNINYLGSLGQGYVNQNEKVVWASEILGCSTSRCSLNNVGDFLFIAKSCYQFLLHMHSSVGAQGGGSSSGIATTTA